MRNEENRALNRIILILVISIIITGGVLVYVNNLLSIKEESMKPEYHFYFIGQNKVDPFWKSVIKGIEEDASERGVKVEFKAPRFTNMEEQLKYMDIAVLSNVDGIITHAFNNDRYRAVIKQAEEKGIPVVVVENEINDVTFDSFVGASSEKIGEEAGKLMIEAIEGTGNILVIDDEEYGDANTFNSAKVIGFIDKMKENDDMSIKEIKFSKFGILSAEEIVEKVIKKNPSINAIYTTNSVDTMGAAQAVINLNKVGKIKIIGYGDTEEIKRLIEQGVVFGTTIGNPELIGKKSLDTLLRIKRGISFRDFVDTGYRIINNSVDR